MQTSTFRTLHHRCVCYGITENQWRDIVQEPPNPNPESYATTNNMQTHGSWQQHTSIICSDRHERQPSKAIGNYKTGNEKKLERGSAVASSSLLTQLRGMSP